MGSSKVETDLTKSFTCSRTKFQEPEIQALAMFWCQKMQYMYDLYKDSGSPLSYSYDPAELANFGEPVELATLLGGNPPAYVLERANQIRAVVPR